MIEDLIIAFVAKVGLALCFLGVYAFFERLLKDEREDEKRINPCS